MPSQIILEFEGVTEYQAGNAALGIDMGTGGKGRGPGFVTRAAGLGDNGRFVMTEVGAVPNTRPPSWSSGWPRPWARGDHRAARERDLDRTGGAPALRALRAPGAPQPASSAGIVVVASRPGTPRRRRSTRRAAATARRAVRGDTGR